MATMELNQIDYRYETCRLRNSVSERNLFHSIFENGIRQPVLGVFDDSKEKFILLDGFKRIRCCRKLHIGMVEYKEVGSTSVEGILSLLWASNNQGLHILEQSRLVEELNLQGMKVLEIARSLERSPAWVSVRLGILTEMGDLLKEEIFSGRFPARNYLYTLRNFTRVNSKKDVNEFVGAVSGKSLSTRDIDILAKGFFTGGEDFRDQILKGHFDWCLRHIKESESHESELNEAEKSVLRSLEILGKYMGRMIYRGQEDKLSSNSFFVQAELFCGGILKKVSEFEKAIRRLNDRARDKKSGMGTLPEGKKEKGDCKAFESQPQDHTTHH